MQPTYVHSEIDSDGRPLPVLPSPENPMEVEDWDDVAEEATSGEFMVAPPRRPRDPAEFKRRLLERIANGPSQPVRPERSPLSEESDSSVTHPYHATGDAVAGVEVFRRGGSVIRPTAENASSTPQNGQESHAEKVRREGIERPIIRSRPGNSLRRNRKVVKTTPKELRYTKEEAVSILKRVRRKMEAYQITQTDLSSFLGATIVTVSRWMNGHHYPSDRYLRLMVRFLDATVVGEDAVPTSQKEAES